MKKIVFIILILPVFTMGQTNPNPNQNYILTTDYQKEFQIGQEQDASHDEKIESITYYDGLGRPEQSIAIRAGGQGQDILTHIEYDDFGRQAKEYLPIPLTGNNGAFVYIIAVNDINPYYKNKFPEDFTGIPQEEINPYSEKVFEASPLNRVLQQAAPGEAWKKGNAHTVVFEYHANTASDYVKNYKVIFINGDTEKPELYLSCSNMYYSPDQLYKYIVKDENRNDSSQKDHTTEEYKNKLGQVILKRTYNNQEPHDTYYVYDDYGNLTFVIPPKANDYVESNNQAKQAIAYSETLLWTKIARVDKTLANEYAKALKELNDEQIAENVLLDKYGGSGEVTITVDEDNDVTIDFDISMLNAMPLHTGLLTTVKSKKEIKDQEIGVLEDPDAGYSYKIYIQNQGIYIKGSGEVQSISKTLTTDTSTDSCAPTQEVLDNLCYRYRYDYRNRLIEKKIPGKGWEYIVYDKLDRPVLTQDANQRQNNEWLFTKYDAFGRVAYTGIYISPDDRSTIQDRLNDVSEPVLFESRLPAGTYENIGDKSVNYTNNAFPDTDIQLLTINYYDNYDFDTDGITMPYIERDNIPANIVTTRTKGLLTGSVVRVLGTADWITTVTYYDSKARVIYIETHNHYLGTEDIVQNELDFTGKVISSNNIHNKDGNTIEVLDEFYYDDQGRLLVQDQQINGGSKERILKNVYDDLGQLVKKEVGGHTPGGHQAEIPALQHIDYAYNIRGWLTSINNDEYDDNDIFHFRLAYNNPTDMNYALYNGNISQSFWQTANDNKERSYTYMYDALNRIVSARYENLTDPTSGESFNLSKLTYDKNGNINTLIREGFIESDLEYDVIDNLSYGYAPESNRLLWVNDNSAVSEGFKDGTNLSLNDYAYDANGNMTLDKNKNITSITYNHLNLPVEVKFNDSDSQSIGYVYDATGIKLQKIVHNNGDTTITSYTGNYTYEQTQSGEVLKYFRHPEGYVQPDGSGGYDYIYQYKDHLGNIRLSYSDTDADGIITPSEIIEENNYYPFGLEHKGYNNVVNGEEYPYRYNGKEWQDELGLDVTAMDYRQYHPDIGRFMNIDALAPFVPSMTPYRFAYNNPIYWSDPYGLIEMSVLEEMLKRSKKGKTVWKNDESLQGFVTEDGGFVGYTSDDTAYNQSPGEATILPGVTVKYKDDKDYSRAAQEIQQQIYSTKWYDDTVDYPGLGINAMGTSAFGYMTYAEHVTAKSFKTANNLLKFHTELTKSQRAWRVATVLGKGYGAAKPLGKYGLKIFKGARMLGPVAAATGVAYSAYNIANGTATTIDYVDAGVGTVSLVAAIPFIAATPVGWAIGIGAGIYFAGRLIYDIYDEAGD